MTNKLYETDSYIKEFEAEVISCEAIENGFIIELDRTAFFPEGGGQAPDEGTISVGNVLANVLDVQVQNGIVLHKTDKALTVGSKVKGTINWPVRFARMQNHTGEHMLSGLIFKKFGYNNVGFHMGSDFITVDTSGKLSEEDIEGLEYEVNQLVYQNREVRISFPSKEELKTLEFRSKKEIEGDIRIVEIDGVDVCACCAPHVSRTGEVGLIKILNAYPNKGGTRIEMLSGTDALRDYCKIHEYNRKAMQILSAKRDEVTEAVQKNVDSLGAARFEIKELREKLTFASMEKMTINGITAAFVPSASFDEMRYCSNTLLERSEDICMLFSESAETEILYIICSKQTDIRPIVKEFNGALKGKGGGKEHYAQGKAASSKAEVLEFIKNINN